jgi:hypothetical protein
MLSYFTFKYNQRTNSLNYKAAWTACVGAVFLIAYDRLYLGVHFYSQCLLGWAFGLLTTTLFVVCEDTLKVIIIATKSDKLAVLIWILFAVLCLTVMGLVAGLSSPSYELLWGVNITAKCGSPAILLQASKTALAESSIVVLAPATAVGLYIARNSDYITNANVISSRLVKLLLVLTVSALGFAAYYVIGSSIESAAGVFMLSSALFGVVGVGASYSGEVLFKRPSKMTELSVRLVAKA